MDSTCNQTSDAEGIGLIKWLDPNIVNGDCLSEMPKIPAQSVDAIITDLPYGTTQCRWDSVIPFSMLWPEWKRLLKPNGVIVLTASQPFTSSLGASNLKWLKYAWVWEKSAATGHLNAKRMPMKLHEDVLVFSEGSHTYNPQGLVAFGKVVRRGHNGENFGKSGTENYQEWTNYPRSILKFKSDPNPQHPTQKPVDLMRYLVRTYTNKGDVVLDAACGSGTTCIAAALEGRRSIGIEKEQKYTQISIQRILHAKTNHHEYQRNHL